MTVRPFPASLAPPETPDLTRTPPALADAWEEEHRDRDADTPSLLSAWLVLFVLAGAAMWAVILWAVLRGIAEAARVSAEWGSLVGGGW